MNYYETLYIVHPALEAGRLKDIILNVEKTITKMGGNSILIDVWGKKKMAYSIKKEKYGTYVLFQFQNETTQNENFNLELKPSNCFFVLLKMNLFKISLLVLLNIILVSKNLPPINLKRVFKSFLEF